MAPHISNNIPFPTGVCHLVVLYFACQHLAQTMATVVASLCDNGWQYNSEDARCYFYDPTLRTFDEAVKAAAAQGAELASIYSSTQNTFVNNLINNNDFCGNTEAENTCCCKAQVSHPAEMCNTFPNFTGSCFVTNGPSRSPTTSLPSRSPTSSVPSRSPTSSVPSISPIQPSRTPSRAPSRSPTHACSTVAEGCPNLFQSPANFTFTPSTDGTVLFQGPCTLGNILSPTMTPAPTGGMIPATCPSPSANSAGTQSRTGAHYLCTQNLPTSLSGKCLGGIRAFTGYFSSSDLTCLSAAPLSQVSTAGNQRNPGDCSTPTCSPVTSYEFPSANAVAKRVLGPTGVVIASSWDALMKAATTPLTNTLYDAQVTAQSWWSGMTTTGTNSNGVSGCKPTSNLWFTDGTTAQVAQVGSPYTTNGGWMSGNTQIECCSYLRMLCACFLT